MILEILKIFKKNYNSRDYGITERNYPVLCVYIGGKRYKVVDIYRSANGQSYFAVYKKTPIKDNKLHGFTDNEAGYFHGEVNRMIR